MQHTIDRTLSPPIDNILLQRLTPCDLGLLEPHLERVQLTEGQSLIEPRQPFSALYFPESVIVSLAEPAGSAGMEVAVVGPEGLIGWPALLGARSTPLAATVQHWPGTALRIAVSSLLESCGKRSSLRDLLLQFIHIMIVQMARSIACHLHDTLDVRLARWLLMRHDRLRGDAVSVRHDEIAVSLNVRRASITDRLHVLEGERLVSCIRGTVIIRNRALLEAFAGDSYGVPESQYRDLIAPFGKSPPRPMAA